MDTAEHVISATRCLHNYLRSTSTIEKQQEEESISPTSVFSNTQRLREKSSIGSIVDTSVRKNLVNYFNYLHTRNETIDQ